MSVEDIDKGLQRYYTYLGKGEAYKSGDDTGQGLFAYYCDENGVDLDDEFKQFLDSQDTLLFDFDEDFPFPPFLDVETMDEERRNKWIFDLLSNLRKYPDMQFEYPIKSSILSLYKPTSI